MDKKSFSLPGITFTGDITIQGDMFNIHDNENVYIDGVLQKKKVRQEPQARDAIIEYVKRLKPLVKEQWQDDYENLWLEILEIKEVMMQVYNKGKQQNTVFNRNLVAQIIHQLGNRVYVIEAKPVVMAEHLEPDKGKDHPVRQKLGEMPDKGIKKAIDDALKEYF